MFPRDFLSLPFLSRNNVDSAATTVVIKIGCPPPALIRPRERFTALLPLLYLFGKDVTAAPTKEQDRKKDRAKVASHSLILVHADGTGRDVDTFGRWDYSSRCLRRRTTVG